MRHPLGPATKAGEVVVCSCCRVFYTRWWDDNVGWGGYDWYPLHWFHRWTRPLVWDRANKLGVETE